MGVAKQDNIVAGSVKQLIGRFTRVFAEAYPNRVNYREVDRMPYLLDKKIRCLTHGLCNGWCEIVDGDCSDKYSTYYLVFL